MAYVNGTKSRSKQKDVTGMRFGRLLVLELFDVVTSKSGFSMTRWKCLCDCGAVRNVRRQHLVSGHTNSCGCLNKEITTARNLKHNCSPRSGHTPEYSVWSTMITRCENPRREKFARYGARGISVCERWRGSFECFLEDMGPKPSPQHSIDRIDNDGNYEPSNCRWATVAEQARNRSSTVMIEAFGKRQCMSDWAKEIGISVQTIRERLKRGVDPLMAVRRRRS